jgi:hypothetical protein
MLVRGFSTTFKANPAGGRPRAGNDTTVTGEPALPSMQGVAPTIALYQFDLTGSYYRGEQ